jgi:hypothetical protein
VQARPGSAVAVHELLAGDERRRAPSDPAADRPLHRPQRPQKGKGAQPAAHDEADGTLLLAANQEEDGAAAQPRGAHEEVAEEAGHDGAHDVPVARLAAQDAQGGRHDAMRSPNEHRGAAVVRQADDADVGRELDRPVAGDRTVGSAQRHADRGLAGALGQGEEEVEEVRVAGAQLAAGRVHRHVEKQPQPWRPRHA